MVKNKTADDANTKLAWKIYSALNANGADIGDASVAIIASTLDRFTPAPTAPAVDWRTVAKQSTDLLAIIAENQHDIRHEGLFRDCPIVVCTKCRNAVAAYERALAVEAGPEQGSG